MLRTRSPWALVSILLFLWSYGLYEIHRNPEDSGTSGKKIPALTLSYLDRNLQLEDIGSGQSSLIRQTLFDPDLNLALQQTRDALASYENDGDLGEEGRRALAVIREDLGTPQGDLSELDGTTRSILLKQPLTSHQATALARRIAKGSSTWWDGRLGERLLEYQENPAVARSLAAHDQRAHLLFSLNLSTNAIWWLLCIGGLAFLPHSIRVIRRGWHTSTLQRPYHYASRWEPSLIIALFLAGDLIAGYFLSGAYLATSLLDTGFIFDVVIDSLWRIAAPLAALLFLFRKPSHAVRSLGLHTAPDWKLVLATFAVVSWANVGFSILSDPWTTFDPSGGLDSMENGWGGLVYGLLSAVILAPVCEEIFYRGLLQRGLQRRFGFWIASGASTIAFMLAHGYDAFGLISVGILGFTLSVLYRATGSLTTLIAIHSLYNLVITLPNWLLYHRSH